MKKLVILLFGVSFLLMGCSNNNTDNSSKVNTITYKSEKGDIEIPSDPQRIVSDYYVGELLKLNANLVGADLTYESEAWENEAKDVENVGQSMEKISSLNPDLIITINEDMYDQYSQIAPTVLIPYGKYQPKELMTELGKITNTNDEAKKWNEHFDSEIADLSKVVENSEFKNMTFSLIEKNGNDLYTYGDNFARGGYILYDELNLRPTEAAQKNLIGQDPGYLSISRESLPEYTGDIVFLIDKSKDKDDMDDYESLPKLSIKDGSEYSDLDAVKNDHVYLIPSYIFRFSDPYSLDEQIDYFMNFFENASKN